VASMSRASVLQKVRRVAYLSFENAVRLHEDAVLLFEERRFPSAQLLSALSIEEIGKYFIHDDVLFHNTTGSEWTTEEIEQFLRGHSYSHPRKHLWFVYQGGIIPPEWPKALIALLETGQLEAIKQRITHVGFPKTKKGIDFSGRVSAARCSERAVMRWITLVNDFFIESAVGTRKGFRGFDIPEIDAWLVENECEKHFVNIWPHMRRSTRRTVEAWRKEPDAEW
jgi:AbiV family abortive infection protein